VRLVTPVSQIYGMVKSATPTSLAVRRRRESRSEEWREHIRLAELLAEYLDPACTFWTSLENKPISAVTACFRRCVVCGAVCLTCWSSIATVLVFV